MAFSPDGQRLASAGWDGTVRLWDGRSGQELLILKGHAGPVHKVAFSPDGQRLASTSQDVTVRLWDSRSGQEVLTLKGPSPVPFHGVAFSPDGQRLASVGYDWKVKFWVSGETEEDRALRWQDWQQQKAAACEKGGAWFAAAFHLHQLHQRHPDDPALKQRLDQARQRWQEAQQAADVARPPADRGK